MNNRRALFFQAIRGPVVLIVLGTLFAMQQSNVARFSQTWPLILIVIGLLKLLERMAAPAVYVPPAPPPPGGYSR